MGRRAHGFVASAVALDARNRQLAGSLAPCGIAGVRDWGRLFHGAAYLAVVTHQEWACRVQTHDTSGHWSGWSAWVRRRHGI